MPKKEKKFGNQQPNLPPLAEGRFRDYNRNYQFARIGKWYSPFLLETKGIKEAADPGAIPGGATPQNEKIFGFFHRGGAR